MMVALFMSLCDNIYNIFFFKLELFVVATITMVLKCWLVLICGVCQLTLLSWIHYQANFNWCHWKDFHIITCTMPHVMKTSTLVLVPHHTVKSHSVVMHIQQCYWKDLHAYPNADEGGGGGQIQPGPIVNQLEHNVNYEVHQWLVWLSIRLHRYVSSSTFWQCVKPGCMRILQMLFQMTFPRLLCARCSVPRRMTRQSSSSYPPWLYQHQHSFSLDCTNSLWSATHTDYRSSLVCQLELIRLVVGAHRLAGWNSSDWW